MRTRASLPKRIGELTPHGHEGEMIEFLAHMPTDTVIFLTTRLPLFT